MTPGEKRFLITIDRTTIGRRVFNLLSDCRTELSEHAQLTDEALNVLLEKIDEILTPVGDSRDFPWCV
jgi:hypothetical protein